MTSVASFWQEAFRIRAKVMPENVTEAFAHITGKTTSESMQVTWENILTLSAATLLYVRLSELVPWLLKSLFDFQNSSLSIIHVQLLKMKKKCIFNFLLSFQESRSILFLNNSRTIAPTVAPTSAHTLAPCSPDDSNLPVLSCPYLLCLLLTPDLLQLVFRSCSGELCSHTPRQ